MDRRTFLKSLGAGAVVSAPFTSIIVATARADTAPFRALRPVPDERDGVVRLHVPEGFRYRSFHDTSTPQLLSDGTRLPGRHDGMAAFAGPSGRSILIRNHEVNGPGAAFSDAAAVYDANAQGGTTTVEVDGFGHVSRAWASLVGTQMNCSGGATPWDSWITCEETVNGPDVGPDFTGVSNVSLTQPHGFIFEVPVGGTASAQPIRAAGRFAHEAVAYDDHRNALYLTEDNFGFPSGFYRYLPPTNAAEVGRIDDGGRLQMLRVPSVPNADLAAAQPRRATYAVDWVDIDDPAPTFAYTPGEEAPTSNNDAIRYVSTQGFSQGAAGFSRLEGAVHDHGVVYFCSTQGGGLPHGGPTPSTSGWGTGSGQVWAYHTGPQILQLIYQSPGRDVLDFPDNVVVSPHGALVLCEDNVEDNYIRGLSRGGDIFDIALNRIPGRSNDEFAGATFSIDGQTLFVNIQASRGMTFAIWGPWATLRV